MDMRSLLKTYVLLILIIAANHALADSWSAPTEMGFASPNSKYVLKVQPAKLNLETPPVASIYEYTDDKYTRHVSFDLTNEWSPVFAVILDSGVVVTFDNWASLGYGDNVVVFYSSGGELLKSYSLEQLYAPALFEKVNENQTVSSTWWRCSSSRPWAHDNTVIVRDTIGGTFHFRSDGTFDYFETGGCIGIAG
ncbi:hypothetical protein [Glaciecola sp. SC05]|uniref:hypothetical protein n=1 Tax=Glaciecola sp. SC05 TaxID=1987355 RepID=UPI0035272A3C